MSYASNVKSWAKGWSRFSEITEWQPGYGPDKLRWWLLYGVNYGGRVLSGGACVSFSRWFYLNREKYRAAKFMDRLLNHVDRDHGAQAGPALWGTTDTSWAARGAVAFWSLVLVAIVGLVWWLVR